MWVKAVDAILRDSMLALRQFRRTPLFAAGIILSLGFGIGASATVFSWMQGILLRPLPGVPHMEELVTVRPDAAHGVGISLDEFNEWRREARTVRDLAAVSLSLLSVQNADARGPESSAPIYGMFVSSNYFTVLGVRPALGRFLVPADDSTGSPLVAVISDAAWHRFFAGAADVVGRTLRVNSMPVRVIGVAAPYFSGNLAVAGFDVWVPMHSRPSLIPVEAETWLRRDSRWMDTFGRLAPGVSRAQAEAEFRAIAARQAATFLENQGRGAQVIPLDMGSATQLKPLFIALVCVTALVILLICCNVANLLLTRAATRQRELGVRMTLGAGRRRIAAQLLTESLMLAALGGIVGLGAGALSGSLLGQLLPTGSSVPLRVHTSFDFQFLAFIAVVTGACLLIFGLAPALLGSRVDIVGMIKAGNDRGSAAGGWLRRLLVATQFAFALAILVCLSLFLRRDRNVNALDLGFARGQEVLLMQTAMSLAGYQDMEQWRQTVSRAAEGVRRVAGVKQVTLGAFVPLGLFGYVRRPIVVPSYPADPMAPERVLVNAVGADYFETMGIPLLSGRSISTQDAPDQPRVCVVNRAFAEKYMAGAAQGRTFTLGAQALVVIGVTENGRYDYHDIDNDRLPLVYTAWQQSPTAFVTIHARTGGDPMALAVAAERAAREVDPAIAFLAPVTLRQYADIPFVITRTSSQILRVLGGVALALASMGLFAVVSYGVTLRTREIGIRLAIGAPRHRIVGQELAGALRMMALGAVAGSVTAAGLMVLLRSQLPMLPALGVGDYAVPLVVLTVCAVVAALSPAARAASVDPVRALRAD